MLRSISRGESALLEALDRIYAAALAPEEWSTALSYISTLVGSGITVLSIHDVTTNLTLFNAACGQPSTVFEYERYYHSINPWFQAGPPPPGEVLPGEAVLSLAELKRTEFYTDFGKRHGIVHSAAAILNRADSHVTYLSLNRGEDRRQFQTRELDLIQRIHPHLNRALAISQNLEFRNGWLELWDHFSKAIVVLKNSRIAAANRIATGIFEQNDGLARAADRMLVAESLRPKLARLVELGSERPAGPLKIQRPSGKAPLVLWSAPLRSRYVGTRSREVIVLIVNPEQGLSARFHDLCHAFDLTRAETRLVEALSTGGSLSDTAVHLGVSRHTAKAQLDAVFRKTNTRRQSELLTLLLRAI